MDDCSEVDDADTAVTTVEGPVIVLEFSFNELFSRVTEERVHSNLHWTGPFMVARGPFSPLKSDGILKSVRWWNQY